MPAPHLQNEDWFLTDEQSGMPGGRGAGGGGGSVTHGHTVFCPKPPPHLTSGWPSHSKRPRQPPPAHMEWLSKQPNRAPGMQGVLDWPVVSLMVQLAAALCRASSTRAATRKPAEPLLPLGPTMLLAKTPAAPKPPCYGDKNQAQPCSESSSRSDPAPDFLMALPPVWRPSGHFTMCAAAAKPCRP